MKAFAGKAVGVPVLIAATCLASTSCSSVPRAATNALTASTGALIGHEFTDGEPEGALLGAAAGVVTGGSAGSRPADEGSQSLHDRLPQGSAR